MATSIIRRSIGRISLFSQYKGYAQVENHRTITLQSAKQIIKSQFSKRLSLAGVGAGGVSLAFFGFGAKEEVKEKTTEEQEEKLKVNRQSAPVLVDNDEDDHIKNQAGGEDDLARMYNEARSALMKEDLEKAEELFKEGLKRVDAMLYVKSIKKKKYHQMSSMFNEGVADVAQAGGRMDEAQAMLEAALKSMTEQGLAQDDYPSVRLILKLAVVFEKQKKIKEAEEAFKVCVSMVYPKVKKFQHQDGSDKSDSTVELKQSGNSDLQDLNEKQRTVALLGQALRGYGRFLTYQGRFKEALNSFEMFRDVCDKTIGKATNQYALILNDLATVNIIMNNYEKAEMFFKEGISISKEANLYDLPTLYCNMGAMQLRKKDYNSAKESCNLGREFAQQNGHPIALRNSESCLRHLKNMKK